MSKEKPLAIRSILSACLSSWAHSPRTLVLLIFIIMLGISEADIAITNFTNQQLQLSSGDVLYYHLAKGFNTIMSSAMFLIMADELPRKISFQNYLLIRTNRVKWLFAQIFMCFILALLMLMLCCVTVFLASLTHVSSDWQWSDCQFVQQGFLMNESGRHHTCDYTQSIFTFYTQRSLRWFRSFSFGYPCSLSFFFSEYTARVLLD